ncbi:MAG: ABC transporter ATP-binding protein [Clostridia bacterium]
MIKTLKNLRKKDWLGIFVSICFIVGQVWLDLKLPDYMSQITTIVQNGGAVSEVMKNGAYMLLCALGSALMAVVVGFIVAKIAANLAKNLRCKIFNKVESFSSAEITKFSTASLITRSTNDVRQVTMAIAMGMQVMIKAPILAVWAIVKILGKSFQWSIATAAAVILMFVIILIVVVFALPKFKKIQTLTDNLNRVTTEGLTGLKVVKAFNAENYQEKKFEGANESLTKNLLFTNRMMGIMNPSMTFIMNGLGLAIYWIGAYLISSAVGFDKAIVFSDMVVFSSYAMQVVMAFMMLTMIFIMLPRAIVSAKRINEVLDTKISIKDGEFEGETEKTGEIVFKNVSFSYPDAKESVLKDINLEINKGETVAFIGSTGSGKSTLINLIPRFFDVTSGEILIDGVNVKSYTQKALHNKIGYVPQRSTLFSGDIKSNVVFGEHVGKTFLDEDVLKALDEAKAGEFVGSLEKGVYSEVSEGGANFSGGQKQRLAIARALVHNAEIYIFDDSFSALDYKTDKALRKTLKKEMKESTVLIVAQRIGTIKNSDKIVVLDNGEIKGIGKHEELMKNCEIYKQIAYSQLSEKELKNE